MRKQNPAVHHQVVALEVPEGDLVDLDIHKTFLYQIFLQNQTKNINDILELIGIQNSAMHYHDATLKVPEGDQVDSDIYETSKNSLNRFVSKNYS